jgi:K+-transporting ATPase ATPase C chain
MKNMMIALRLYMGLTIVCGLLYTLAVTAIARCVFPRQSQGSLVLAKGRVIGSELLGQAFTGPEYFWPRPSTVAYDPMPSGASNLSVAGNALKDTSAARARAFRNANGLPRESIVPGDMVFSSGSGLDPHISPEAARLQINRIAGRRNMTSLQKEALAAMVERSIEQSQLGFLGMPRVNVLMLNCMLDNVKQN